MSAWNEAIMGDGDPYFGTEVSRGKIVPLISSEVPGTLGLMHLPRLWLKALLHATDTLAEDWGCGPGGLDKITMDFVGIDPDAFVPWLLQAFPTFAECEAWVQANARALDEASIARANRFLSSHPLPRGLGPKFRAYLDVEDDRFDVGIRLNNLDDWMAVHQYVGRYGAGAGSIVPAISPRTTGPLGVAGLPRDWLIALLGAEQLLPPSYRFADDLRAGAVLRQLGVDPSVAHAFIASERPTYVHYEGWLRVRASLGDATIEGINAGLDIDTARGVERYDWELLHRTLDARRRLIASTRNAGIYSFSVNTALSAHADSGH